MATWTVRPKKDTTANWKASGRILEVNEWGVEETTSGKYILRIETEKTSFLIFQRSLIRRHLKRCTTRFGTSTTICSRRHQLRTQQHSRHRRRQQPRKQPQQLVRTLKRESIQCRTKQQARSTRSALKLGLCS